MDEVAELLKTWELSDLIPKFEDQAITIQALSALTPDDIKDIIPQIGRRVLFMRCWKEWKAKFCNISLSNLNLLQFELHEEAPTDTGPKDLIVLTAEEQTNEQPIINIEQELASSTNSESWLLENLLRKSLEASSLLIYKGGTLDGDAARNLLASVIATEILNNHTNSSILGSIYFKWTKLIRELFPGERITTYYIPACTTATGAILQARGKLVHQVLNKRRRLQQLGTLTTKRKRSREERLAATSSSSRPKPVSIETLDEDVEDDLQWLRNSSEPWSLVEMKWNRTFQHRRRLLLGNDNDQTLESYLTEYPALRKPHGYTLLNIDFDAAYEEKKDNLFVYFPVAQIRIFELLNKRKSKDNFSKDLVCLADESREDDKNLGAFLSTPHLLNTTTVKPKNNQKKWASCSWKPSSLRQKRVTPSSNI